MRSTDSDNSSDSEDSGDLELHSFEQVQPCEDSKVKGPQNSGVDSVQLARFRAACKQKAAAQKVRESEARARALAVGSATEELRREQKKRKKAVERAKQCEIALEHAESTAQQLQYTNIKLEQQLASTEAAARTAAGRTNRCLRNLRNVLCSVEADTADKFAKSQQQVQHLISVTKQLQSYINTSCSNSQQSSPESTQHHLQTNCNANNNSSKATQAISSIFQALALLGQLLVPCSEVLQDEDAALPTVSPTGAAEGRLRSGAWACTGSLVPVASGLATTAADTSNNSSKDASCLAAQSAIHQAQYQDLAAEKAALQHRCESLQQQCDELQQKLQRQAGNCAELCHNSQVQDTQHLAEVASLQADKLKLQSEVSALQQSLQSAHSALQSLRDQHEQQTSRLASANADMLQLRSHSSKLEHELRQQQQDAASALCIVSNREASSAGAAMPTTAAEGGARRSPGCSNLLSNLGRPASAAAALGESGSPGTAIGVGNAGSIEQMQEGNRYQWQDSSRAYNYHGQQHQHDEWDGLHQGNSTGLGTAGGDATNQTLGQALLQRLQLEQQRRQEQQWQQQHGITGAAGAWNGLWQHTTTTFRPLSGDNGASNKNRYPVAGDSVGKLDNWSSILPAANPNAGVSACNGAANTNSDACTRPASCSATATAAADAILLQQQDQHSIAGIGFWDRETTQGASHTDFAQAAASRADPRPDNSFRSPKHHFAGDRAAISTSWQQQQQQLTAAERHRALVADADAALARLAACRRAAVAASPTVLGQVPRGDTAVRGSMSDSMGHQLGANNRAAGHSVPLQASGGVSNLAGKYVAADVGTARYMAVHPRGHHSAPQPAGVADLLGSRYLDQSARQSTAGRLFSPGGRAFVSTSIGARELGVAGASAKYSADLGGGGGGNASKQSRTRIHELQQELDDLDDDFAHAEAQLQVATARLSGNAAVC